MSLRPTISRGISVIVPTIGRPDSLRRMLDSLCRQTHAVHEVIVADGSSTCETSTVVSDTCWERAGLKVERVAVHPPNAVRQRQAAIGLAGGEYLLLLDDDVVLETDCAAQMVKLLGQDTATVAVFGDFNNQSWPMPTRAWRFYLRYMLRMPEGTWQGQVVGPLLRFGYNPRPLQPMPMEWLGTCNSMIRRLAYEKVGGFSDFFLHRCTMNEDVDLGIKLSRVGRIVFCPSARLGHFHAPGGRVAPMQVAEDDLYNRYLVMRRTQQRSARSAFGLVLVYFTVETGSNLGGCLRRRKGNGLWARTCGRLRAMVRILALPIMQKVNA